MSKIMDIIKNEKVEWRKLGEVCDIIKGKQFNKRDMLEDGKYPVINGGITPSGYVEVYNQSANTITISQGGASAGFINFIENKFWLGAHAFAINPKDTVLNRYIYHFLKLNQEKLQDKKEGAGIPSISKTTLESLEIPIPSLETQEKIVKVLDKFTNYVTELQAELQAELQDRTKQYSYYRNMLLSKENLNKLSKKLDKIEDKKYELRITTLGEIGEFTRGNGLQKSDFRDVGKPVIHYGQIYTKYNISTDKTFSFTDEETFKRLRKAKPNDILIATTSENIEDVAKCVVWLGNTEIGFSGDMYSYNTNENSKYIAYYFQTIEFQRQKERKVTGTKLIRIHGEDMAKFIIPLPSISIQNKVVEILDQFQSLLSETQGLLPKEIEQRQKQYEFYREKLLTFDEKYDSLPACLPACLIVGSKFFNILKEAAAIVEVELYNKVKWKTLGEIGNFENGTGMPKTFFDKDGEIGAIHYGHIYTKYNLFVEKPIVKISLGNAKRLKKVQKGNLVIAKTSENIDDLMKTIAYLGDDEVVTGGHSAIFKHQENPKYLSYVFNGYTELIKQKNKLARGVKVIELSISEMEKIKIPLPSLTVQNYIVSILDKFDTLINDLTKGLLKEIELRQKQYEFYREKLLDFSKNN